MRVFSQIRATFDYEFTSWLPPCDELGCFIEQLSGFVVEVGVVNNKLTICGSLEAINCIEEALRSFVEKEELSEPSENDENSEHHVNDQHDTLGLEENADRIAVQHDGFDEDDDADSDDGCLNIEVFHAKDDESESGKKKVKFSCSLCSFKSQRESHFQRHTALHQTMTTHRCEHCSFSTLRFTHLRRHQVIHNAKFSCSACSYTTDDSKLLARHKRIKHRTRSSESDNINETVRKCPACPYQTSRSHLYDRHMKVHSAEESKGGPNLFICSQCDYRTTRKIHYTRHIRDVHRQSRPYLCHHCGKAFKRPDALKQHSILHVNTDGADIQLTDRLTAFQCRVCSKFCHSRAHLKEHQAVHSSERSFLCEICGASFKTRSVQRKHIANLHQNPRAYPCNVCNKRFNTNYALRRHMKQHPEISDGDEAEANQGDKLVTLVLPSDKATSNDTITLTVKLNPPEEDFLFMEEPNATV